MREKTSVDTSTREELTPLSVTFTLPSSRLSTPTTTSRSTSSCSHPVDQFIERADKSFEELLKKQTHHLEGAANTYRKARGRHPPPGFRCLA
jgi:hypothetical protein